MKRPILLSLLFSAGLPAASLTCLPALAQVTSNDDAIPAAPAQKPAVARAPSKPAESKAVKSRHDSSHAAPAGKTTSGNHPASAPGASASSGNGAPSGAHLPAAQRVGAPPDVPAQPPRPVVIPPPGVTVPTHPPVQPDDIKADPDAKGASRGVASGLRLTFDPGSSGMTQAMIDAVRAEAKQLAGKPGLRVTLWSSASGTTEDLSTPRRISLARALAVRSILIREGVATTRIYPRATGLAQPGTEPADRLDIIAEGAVPAPISEAQFGTASRTPTP